jgi:hypothetical protein
VFWYIGVPAVVLGTLGAALLSRRCLRGWAPAWTLPLMVFGWAIVATLYRPAITPDHPWASRRLVPAVLPGFILLAVWVSGWLAGRLGQRGWGRAARGLVVSCCAAALLIPAVITTFGLGIEQGGPAGIRLTADGLAFKRTYQGEIAAVDRLCAAIPPRSSVVFIADGGSSEDAARRLAEVVRGMCGDPVARVARLNQPRFNPVQLVVRGIERAGRRPVLLAGDPSLLKPYGGQIRQVMRLRTRKDENALTTPPTHTLSFVLNVWMSEPAP